MNTCILSSQGKIFSFLLPIFKYLHEVVTSMHLSFVLMIKHEGEFFFFLHFHQDYYGYYVEEICTTC